MTTLIRLTITAAALAAAAPAQTGAGGAEPLGVPLRLVSPGALPPRRPEPGPAVRTHQKRKVDPIDHDREGLALEGYDVVSYLDRKPGKGRKEFSADYGGLTWVFATAANRDEFRRDPERLLPQYGGFCAYSVSIGSPAHADPRIFEIADRKLYLFFDPAVRSVWQQEREHAIAEATAWWPQVHR
jgi:YHS domain-containing protein